MKSIVVEEKIVTIGGKSIYGTYYRPEGEGKFPLILLSHGYNGIGRDFDGECRFYAENGYAAYAFDFCGGSVYSKSSGKSVDMSIFTEKEDLLDVFDHFSRQDDVDKEKIFLFGGSQGGLVTLLAAGELKEKVCAVALYYPALCIADDWRKKYADVRKIPKTMDYWGLRLGENYFLAVRDFYVFDHIGAYQGDVLIVHGDSDPVVPLSYSEQAVKTLASASLVVLKGEAHGYSDEGREKAMTCVLDFLNRHV